MSADQTPNGAAVVAHEVTTAARGSCGAKRRDGTGGRCELPAGWGTPNVTGPCKLHGGRTRNHLVAAATAQARLDAGVAGVQTPTTAGEAIELSLAMWRGRVDVLAGRLRELEAAVKKDADTATLHAYLAAFDNALDRLTATAKVAADVDVDDRRVRVDERRAGLLAQVVNLVMSDLVAAGLSDDLRRLAADSFTRHAGMLDDTVTGTAVEIAA